jgi:ABC-2 type transport system ATP-binding protein
MSTPALTAHHLHKAYAGQPALVDVSLQLQPGQLSVLLGPNGAGKSTLMQVLTGLFNPDQGEVEVLGHPMRHAPARALAGLGVVFQQSALDLDLSVQANLLYHADLHGMPRTLAREQMQRLLPALGLEGQDRTVTRQLSGGNRRKVELVRALLHRPGVLLMDEATVGLDPASRQQLLATVTGLCRSDGLAVLWATHLLDEARPADRLVLLQQGRVRFDGTPAAFMDGEGPTDFEARVLARLGVRPVAAAGSPLPG